MDVVVYLHPKNIVKHHKGENYFRENKIKAGKSRFLISTK